jgi:hypothetical protein
MFTFLVAFTTVHPEKLEEFPDRTRNWPPAIASPEQLAKFREARRSTFEPKTASRHPAQRELLDDALLV